MWIYVCAFLVILDRIPWVAPEMLESPDKLTLESDKWSFGATVWEIFNSGNAPLRDWDLDRVLPLLSLISQTNRMLIRQRSKMLKYCILNKMLVSPSDFNIMLKLFHYSSNVLKVLSAYRTKSMEKKIHILISIANIQFTVSHTVST